MSAALGRWELSGLGRLDVIHMNVGGLIYRIMAAIMIVVGASALVIDAGNNPVIVIPPLLIAITLAIMALGYDIQER